MEPVTNEIFGMLLSWLPAFLCAVGAVVIPRFLKGISNLLRKRVYPYAPKWGCILLDGFEKPLSEMVRFTLLYAAMRTLPLPTINTPAFQAVLGKILQVVVVLLVMWGGWRSAPICHLLLSSAENHLDVESNRTMIRFFENVYRALIVLLGIIMALDLLGVPVTGLLTGAGVAGLAVSLAAQSTLSNLIAGVTLVMEHPFGIGDYVVLGSYEGTVEDISFRSTRIRTADNVVITVENSKICSEYIQNVTNRTTRLWQFTIGVTYDTSAETIETLCADLKTLLGKNPHVCRDTMQVMVSEFADSSINIMVRVYVDTLALAQFNELKSLLNLQIMRLMKQDGCAFAFPSASIYLEQT